LNDSSRPRPESPDVSVVICTYTDERWDDVRRSIASARAQEPQPDEIIVIVDHNPDLLRRLADAEPDVTILPSQGIPGVSGARSTGVKAASHATIAFLDDDARARPGWLAALLAAYKPGIIAVGGAAHPDWEAGRPGWFPFEFDWIVGCTYRGMPRQPTPVRNLIGANMSFRAHALAAAGDFDPRLGRVRTRPVGAEETEMCIRASAVTGGIILFDPAAEVDHHVPRSRMGLSYFLARCFAEGWSKGILVRVTGSETGLRTERTYALGALPRGTVRELGNAMRGDVDGLRRAIAIGVGLTTTTLGYGARIVTDAARGLLRGTREAGAAS
jgi:glycosyltransferase involved in cell wall biosynthesis